MILGMNSPSPSGAVEHDDPAYLPVYDVPVDVVSLGVAHLDGEGNGQHWRGPHEWSQLGFPNPMPTLVELADSGDQSHSGSSGSDSRPHHGDDGLRNRLPAVAPEERTDVAAEAHGGDGVSVHVCRYGPTLVKLRQDALEESDAWLDRVLAHGAAGAVGSIVTQLAAIVGAHVIGTGRADDRQKALEFGAHECVDPDTDDLHDVGDVDLVLDVIGGDIQRQSAALIRAGGILVSVVGPVEAHSADGRTVDFVVEADRAELVDIATRVRDGRLRPNIGIIAALEDAVATFNSSERATGKTVIRVRS
jgi:hypothetical protein